MLAVLWCSLCLYHFGECSHSFSAIQRSWWASVAVNSSVPWGMHQAKPMAEIQLTPWEFLVISFRRWKKKPSLEFNKHLFCLPANNTGAIRGDVLPANHLALKQLGVKIPWLFIFPLLTLSWHSQVFALVAGKNQGCTHGDALCAWFGFFFLVPLIPGITRGAEQ